MRSIEGDLRDEVVEDSEDFEDSEEFEGLEDCAVLDAAVSRLLQIDVEALSTRQQLVLLEHLERVRRRLPAVGHPLINALQYADPREIDTSVRNDLANRLRITRGELSRRIHEAAELGPRRALIGQPLDPVLAVTAAAQRDGALGRAQISIIRECLHRLPGHLTDDERSACESDLVDYGCDFRPDELAGFAAVLEHCYDQDGHFSDADRARRRGIVIGRQGRDGMSPISGYLDPQARATLDAVCAKLAAPGMANPADDQPCISGTPSQEAIQSDHRSPAQRTHDGLHAGLRALLASGDLGQHNGLPTSIIVSVTLAELEAATGRGHTGSGGRLPMTDVIALASQAHHYLRIYDGAKELALLHTRRVASPAQRLLLYARDRGCTRPGCPVPADRCEAHHVTDYAHTHTTDIHDLALACGCDHKTIGPDGWRTRTNRHGHTEWLPPAHLDRGQPRVNTFHHPEKLLHHNTDQGDAAGEEDGEPR
ncbi:MAG TPA: HNH endonuclease signature motif containing protein [Mycobacterium sp.]|nr:HNH endonuclease signature motif containing protein [Mycobacterium sp.]